MPYPSSTTYPGATVFPGIPSAPVVDTDRWDLVYGSKWALTPNVTRWDLDPDAPNWQTAS